MAGRFGFEMAFISTALWARAGLHYMRLNSSEMTLILRHFSAAADSALLRPDEITPAIDSQLKDQTKIPNPLLLSLSDHFPLSLPPDFLVFLIPLRNRSDLFYSSLVLKGRTLACHCQKKTCVI